MVNNKVTFYTIDCPKCKVLEMKLQQKKIAFEIVRDVTAVTEFGAKNNINSAPILEIDGKVMDFSKAISWINNERGN